MSDQPSCFYASRFSGRPFPFTYLLLEHITASLETMGEQAQDDDLALAAVRESIAACGIRKKPSSDDIVYTVTRLKESYKPEGEKEEAPAVNTKSFAGEYLQWVQGLTPETTCIYVAGHDIEQARHLYCEVDCEEVKAMANEKITQDWQAIKVGFESVLFGFGGGYGEGEGGFEPPPLDGPEDKNSTCSTLSDDAREKMHQQMGF